MENFDQITDDFLSSGFHQLYTELNDDELINFDYNYYGGSGGEITNNYLLKSDQNFDEKIYPNSYTDLIEFDSNLLLLESNSNINNNYNNNQYYNHSYPSVDEVGTDNSIIESQSQLLFDWELDLENLLLDGTSITSSSSPQSSSSSSSYNFDDQLSWICPINILPDKTPLCSDSCDLFLKESSENLKLNSQKLIKEQFENGSSEIIESVKEVHSSVISIEEKIFPCTFGTCCKIYAKPAHLKAHMRRHLGDKPYVCTWPNCVWKFSRSDELARHRRSHSGIKPYKCCYCTKCFARSDHLAKHRKVHERKMAAAKLKEMTNWTNNGNNNINVARNGRKSGQYKG